jgi:long-chain acyl-CoA synthetase
MAAIRTKQHPITREWWDIGFMNRKGYLFLTDRKKDWFKVSGFQIGPREIEKCSRPIPPRWRQGSRRSFLGCRGNFRRRGWYSAPARRRPLKRSVRFSKERLVPYKVPVAVSIVADLPKSAIGKVLRRKLHELDAADSPASAE